MKKSIVSFLVLSTSLISLHRANAQNDLTKLFLSGADDLEKVATGYIKPVGLGFAAGMGGSWYNTAANHSTLGFDVTLGSGILIVPNKDRSFSLSGLKYLTPKNGATSAPSFSGSGDGVDLQLKSPNDTVNGIPTGGKVLANFATPQGVSKILPSICLQGTIGLPKGFDLSVRYLPQTTIGGVSGGLWGIGVKHDIKQWFPVIKKLPISLSVMVGYTRFNLSNTFDKEDRVDPNALINSGAASLYISPADNYDNQGFELKSDSYMANVIVSKNFVFFTPYLGLGFTQNNFRFNFKGNFPTLGDPKYDPTAINSIRYDVVPLVDPIKLDYKSFMPNATVGFRLKFLGIVTFNAQYTFQEYSAASVGLGFGFR